jgi:hypothetical protein
VSENDSVALIGQGTRQDGRVRRAFGKAMRDYFASFGVMYLLLVIFSTPLAAPIRDWLLRQTGKMGVGLLLFGIPTLLWAGSLAMRGALTRRTIGWFASRLAFGLAWSGIWTAMFYVILDGRLAPGTTLALLALGTMGWTVIITMLSWYRAPLQRHALGDHRQRELRAPRSVSGGPRH